jgi:hypothetical protein
MAESNFDSSIRQQDQLELAETYWFLIHLIWNWFFPPKREMLNGRFICYKIPLVTTNIMPKTTLALILPNLTGKKGTPKASLYCEKPMLAPEN